MSVEILVPRKWTRTERLLALCFPRRRATIPPASWVEELMQKRFGCLIICPPCGWKYGDGLRRWAYARHPDMKSAGKVCDFCRRLWHEPTALWFKEEHRYPEQRQYAEEQRRFVSRFQGDLWRIRSREARHVSRQAT